MLLQTFSTLYSLLRIVNQTSLQRDQNGTKKVVGPDLYEKYEAVMICLT